MLKPSIATLLACLVLGQLAGCGKSPASASPSRTTRTAAPAAAAPPPIAANGYISPEQILPGVRQAQQNQQGFSARLNTWERGSDGSKSVETLDVWWKRPNTLKVDIVKGSSDVQGTLALWDGSASMKVKPSYVPFAVSLDITDSRLVTKNNWTVRDTDISSMLNVLLDANAKLTSLGPQVIDGKSVFLLEATSSKSPKGVTKEQIGIDMQQNLPVVRLMYKGDTLVYKLVAATFKLGVPTDAQLSI